MIPEKAKIYKAAVKVDSEHFSVMEEGIRTLERRIRPIVGTYSYIGSEAAETEILGYVQTLVFTADRVENDPANDYLYSLACAAGTDCETEVFVYCENDEGQAARSHIGRTYPAAIAVTKLSADEDTGYLGFGGTVYLNGTGRQEEKIL